MKLFRLIQRTWDWWIYGRSVHSIKRISIENPGIGYLIELRLRRWNSMRQIPPSLRRSTEVFEEAMWNEEQKLSTLAGEMK